MHLARSATVLGGALAALILGAGSASAHECFNTQKNDDSKGYSGTYDVATNTFTPSGAPGNPTYIKVILPDGSVVWGFTHSGPGGVVPGAKDCDGKGLDNAEACFG